MDTDRWLLYFSVMGKNAIVGPVINPLLVSDTRFSPPFGVLQLFQTHDCLGAEARNQKKDVMTRIEKITSLG